MIKALIKRLLISIFYLKKNTTISEVFLPPQKISKIEQMKLLLQKAGWFEGRHVDIAEFEEMCKSKNIRLFSSARQFLHSYWKIEPSVKLRFLDDPKYERTFELDFSTELWQFEVEDYYDDIYEVACEEFIVLGEFGYYYPGVIAIGVSGKLYVWHDYSSSVDSFDSLEEAMASELRMHVVDTRSLL